MAINLTDNIFVGQQKPLESKAYNNLTPYTNVAQVNSSIATSVRYVGLTVYIVDPTDSTKVIEYWYQGGIANINLVVKDTPSTGGTVSSISGTDGITVVDPTNAPILSLGNITPDSIVSVGTVAGSNLSGINTGDNSLNTNSNTYTDTKVAALTTDLVPETTTNKYVSTASTLPTIANGKIGYNTIFSTVPNTTNALVWNKGYFVSDGSKNIPLGLDTRLVSSLNAIGDSFTNNFNLTANEGYLNKVGNFRGWVQFRQLIPNNAKHDTE